MWVPPQPAQREDSGPGPGQRKRNHDKSKSLQTAGTSLHPLASITEDSAAGARGPCLLGLEPHSKLGPSLGPRLHTVE